MFVLSFLKCNIWDNNFRLFLWEYGKEFSYVSFEQTEKVSHMTSFSSLLWFQAFHMCSRFHHFSCMHSHQVLMFFLALMFFSALQLFLAAEKSVLESFKSISFVFLFLSVMHPLQQPLLILVSLPLPAAWESTNVKEYKLSPVEEINLLDPEKGSKA